MANSTLEPPETPDQQLAQAVGVLDVNGRLYAGPGCALLFRAEVSPKMRMHLLEQYGGKPNGRAWTCTKQAHLLRFLKFWKQHTKLRKAEIEAAMKVCAKPGPKHMDERRELFAQWRPLKDQGLV